jgi:hypothetical protein
MRPQKPIDVPFDDITIEPVPAELAHLPPAEMLERLMHDCPECRAARARGEVPKIVAVPPLPAKRDVIRDRRPRWRSLKRRARR